MEEKKCLIAPEDAGARVDVFLAKNEPDFSRTRIKDLILEGRVFLNGTSVKPHAKLKPGDILTWRSPEPRASSLSPEDIPLKIFFEDEDIIVLDKPAGMVVHPGAGGEKRTLVHALLFHTRCLSSVSAERPGIVHRLDKETSGVMVVAKNNAAHLALAKEFRKHAIERRYIALVTGSVAFDEGVIDAPLKRHAVDRKKIAVSYTEEARPAETFYRVLRRYKGVADPGGEYTALELFPKTGRTHQLRVHLAFLGHPILGDPVYGKKKNFSRLALHAKDLGFIHPSTGESVKFSSPLPPEIRSAMPGLKI